MAEKQKWQVPRSSLYFSPPDEFIPDSQKDAEWFTQYARWIVSSFYNQARSPFSVNDVPLIGMAEEAIVNWSYYFARQANYEYKHATTSFDGKELPAVWIPGGKVTQLIKHLRGVLQSSIESIEVTATNLSKNVQSERANMLEKLMIKYDYRDQFKQFPKGVEFRPVDDPAVDGLDSPEEIEKYVSTWQDKYSILAEKIGCAQMYMDHLDEKFLQSGTNQYIGGLSGILTEVQNGRVVNTVLDSQEIIWDNRINDPYNRSAMCCGFVKHAAPYQEVINRFKNDLTEDQIKEIRVMAESGYSNIDDFTSYYNTGFGWNNHYGWWNRTGTSTMTVAYATVYFIAPRNYPFKKMNNRFGVERNTKINPDKKYDVGGGERIEGKQINGDWSGWDIYQATLIGNKYVCCYGLMSNALRENNDKGRPILPIRILCSDMAINQGMPLVSQLRSQQNNLDRLAYAIEQKVANDWGKNYIFNGSKMGQVPSTEIANDLKSMHVHVAVGVSGESDDPTNLQRMVEPVDMTLDNAIIHYITLRNEQKAEMDEIASVSRIALGQQAGATGKAVQQRTIAQNSYGTAALQRSIINHFNQVVQYNVNLKQMLYSTQDSVEEALTIGDEGSYLLRILDPKDFGTQQFQVYIDIFSTYSEQDRADIKAIAMANAQNGGIDLIDFIEHILLSRTPKQAVEGLKLSRNKQIKEQNEQAKSQQQAEGQQAAALQEQKALLEASLIQQKELNENWRTVQKILADLAMTPPQPVPTPAESPLNPQLAQASAPPPQNQPIQQ